MILAVSHGADVAVDLLLVLVAAGAASLLLGKLRLAAIPGYLIAGVLLGALLPNEMHSLDFIKGLAVVLLMFGIGLHLDIDTVRRGMGPILMIGLLSTAIVTALGTPMGMVFGLPWYSALAVAMAFSMSSTAVVLRVLQQRRELESTWGRVAFGVLLVQDLVTIAIMPLIPVLAKAAKVEPVATEEAAAGHGGGNPLIGLVVIAAFIVVAKAVLPRLLGAAAKVSAEVMLVLSAAVALGAAALTTQFGLSPELGAFTAGFVLAGTPMRYELSGQLAPMRDLFMAVFFTTVGLGADLSAIMANWWIILLAAASVLAVKTAGLGIAAWAMGAPGHVSAMTAMSLSQAGEFSLVILEIAAVQGLVSPGHESLALSVAIVTLIVTPSMVNAAHALAPKIAERIRPAPWAKATALRDSGDAPADGHGPGLHGHVVIAGFGPVGRAVADRLAAAGIAFTIVELNPETVKRQRALGRAAFYGDVTNEEVLRSAGIETAAHVVICIPDDGAMLRACRVARKLSPQAGIFARANAMSNGLLARGHGATEAVIEEIVTAEVMAQRVLMKVGVHARRPATMVAPVIGEHGAEPQE